MDKNVIYMTKEMLSRMSVDEIAKWLTSLDKIEDETEAALNIKNDKLSIGDFDRAYKSGEFQAFLEQTKDLDITPMLFEDSEDINSINRHYKAIKTEAPGANYESLYASYYQYIKRVNPLWEVGAERLETWASLQDEYRTVFSLTPDTATKFENLCAPYEYSLIGREDHYAFGSVRKTDGEKQACGILIFEIAEPDEERDEAVCVIRWIYVDESMRGMHVADDLMAAMYHTLNELGIKAVSCEVPAKNIIPLLVCDFLTCWWIYFNLRPADRITVTLSEAANLPEPKEKTTSSNFASLEEVGGEVFFGAIERIRIPLNS